MNLISENPRVTGCQKCQKSVCIPSVTFGTPLNCVSRISRLLPHARMETKPCGGPSTSLYRLDPNPAVLFEHSACTDNVVGSGELGPVLTVDRASGVAIAHVA